MARNRYQIFQFNLVPPKSQVEVELEAERDDSLVYSMILVFFALFVYVVLTLTRSFLILPRIESTQQRLDNFKQQTQSFQDVRSQNGELFIKGETLSEILKKDLSANEIFRVAQEISSINANVGVVNYSREQSGIFVFEFLANNVSLVPEILQKANTVSGVSNVFIRDVSVFADGKVLISAELNIAGTNDAS